jgi:hypothetical protein
MLLDSKKQLANELQNEVNILNVLVLQEQTEKNKA